MDSQQWSSYDDGQSAMDIKNQYAVSNGCQRTMSIQQWS
jgi:hypothetical protein